MRDSDALRRIDDHLDGYDDLPPEEAQQLNSWLRENPENADRAFQRVMLHVLLSRKLSDPDQPLLLGGRSSAVLIDTAAKEQTGRGWLLLLFAVVIVAALVSLLTTMLFSLLPLTNLENARNKNFEGTMVGAPGELPTVTTGRLSSDVAWGKDEPAFDASSWPVDQHYTLKQGVAEFRLADAGKFVVAGPAEFTRLKDRAFELVEGRCGISWRPGHEDEIWTLRTSNASLAADSWARYVVESLPDGGTVIDLLEGDLQFLRHHADASGQTETLYAGQSIWIDRDKVVVVDADWVERHVGLVRAALDAAEGRPLDTPLVYEGFGYLETPSTSSTFTHAGLSLEHGGWGWADCWMESGSLGASIDHAPLQWQSSSDKRGIDELNYRDRAGRRLKVSGGLLRTSYGAVSRTFRTIQPADWHPDMVDDGGLGADGSEVWISFLAQSYSSEGGARYAFLRIGDERAGVRLGRLPGPQQSVWSAEVDHVNGPVGALHQSALPAEEAVFYVARIQFRNGEDKMQVWLNPELDEPPAVETATFRLSVPDMRLQEISIEGRYSTDFDEIRLGPSYASVSPYGLD